MKYSVFLLFLCAGLAAAQSNFCVTSAVPPLVRAEGLTERTGDIVYQCSGTANATLAANFTVAMNTNITNNVSSGNTLTGIVFTVDSGGGPQPVLVQPQLTGPNSLVFNGVVVGFSAQGTAALRIAGIRVNARPVPLDAPIIASLGVNAAGLLLTVSQTIVGRPERGLYTSSSGALVCSQFGSPLPDTLDFASLLAAGTAFATTRVTEGIADAFGPRTSLDNTGGATGERILVTYSGLPSDARLFVPDLIAGSDAVQPTAGGDYGPAASGGVYSPSANGSLLLARVSAADSTGNGGGSPVFQVGLGTTAFNSVSELTVVNGVAYAVYEVVDANPFAIESAQFPTFLGLLPDGSRVSTAVTETVFLAPSSTVGTASTTEAVPRFAPVVPLSDCTIVTDCAARAPQLDVDTTPLKFVSQAGSGTTQQGYFTIHNDGAGKLFWATSVTYNGAAAGWLTLDAYAGFNNTSVRVFAATGGLASGVYSATITVSTGGASGGAAVTQTVPVVFSVTPAPVLPPAPVVTSVENGASFLPVPVVPGSISTVIGSNFAGANVLVTFDGLPGQILFSNATQINVLVPLTLPLKNSTVMVVTVDGVGGTPQTVGVAPFEPGIFAGGILNQDGTVNGAGSGAPAGSIIAIWGTGMSGPGVITAHIADRDIAVPYYAGEAPGLPGVQQVNLVIPPDLGAMNTEVYVCGAYSAAVKVCSLPVGLVIR
ncbi:MAG TPA: hypothetical protein VGN17_12235 [Bryobacteraceae bacterium]|jgi:uncharacterized protein (TIGR03437 family)